ncbi:MAG: putative Ig domain-containing protein, partial [Proteobacteria bacterium]|nr:putative Ig domain-containing protein [Pseudomonadota bacterium]
MDYLSGGSDNDTLLGGNDNDTLSGGTGNDTLIGGKGFDTYIWNPGDGTDTIIEERDDDGHVRGVIKDQAGNILSKGIWEETGPGTGQYVNIETGKEATMNSPFTMQMDGGGQIILEDFESGDFGITLVEYKEIDQSFILTGDDNGNCLYNHNEPLETGRDVRGAGGRDMLSGALGDDFISGGDGDDWINGNGGADRIEGGAGNDYISWIGGGTVAQGGDGDDIITASAREQFYVNFVNQSLTDRIWADASQNWQNWHSENFYVNSDGYLSLQASGGVTPGTYTGASVMGGGEMYRLTIGTDGLIEMTYSSGTVYGADIGHEIAPEPDAEEGVFLSGGGGNDVLIGHNQADHLSGGTEQDILVGNGGNDILDGGAGDDNLAGGDGDDIQLGGDGNDQIFGESGSDTLYGEAGNDSIWADSQSTLLSAQDGDDYVDGGSGDDQIVGQGGNDTLFGGDGQDVIFGDNGDNSEFGGDDTIYGDNDDDILLGEAGNDILSGGEDNDQLFGGIGDDTLSGDSGDDTLFGQDGDDILSGGRGNDILDGGNGNDTYNFYIGDGTNTINNNDAAGTDIVSFGSGIGPGDIIATNEGNNLVLRVGNNGDQIVFSNWSLGVSYQVDSFNFSDGSSLTKAEFLSSIPSLQEGTTEIDYLIGSVGMDILIGAGGNDRLIGGDGDDVLNGGEDNDQLFGGTGNDVLTGGTGNDTLVGSTGNDTYIFNLGDGADTIENQDAIGFDIVSFGPGIGPESINTATKEGQNLILRIGDNGDQITFYRWFNGPQYQVDNFSFSDGSSKTSAEIFANLPVYINGSEGNDYLYGNEGADIMVGAGGHDDLNGNEGDDLLYGGDGNDNLFGSNGNDELYGGNGNDYLDGGDGNDDLYGGWGDDRYSFSPGTGIKNIYDYDMAEGLDTLYIDRGATGEGAEGGDGVTDADILVFKDGNNLLLKIKDSDDQINLIDYYAAGTFDGETTFDNKINRIEFSNGVVWDQAMVEALAVEIGENHTPVVNTLLPTLEVRTGILFTYAVPENTIIDPDPWDSITYEIKMEDGSYLPEWLSFDAESLTLSGIPPAEEAGTLQFVLWGTDNYDGVTSLPISLNINENQAPVLTTALTDQAVPLQYPFTYSISESAFADPDTGDALSYTATLSDGSDLPSWLNFDPATLTFSGRASEIETVGVQVTATDTGGLSVSDVFDFSVSIQDFTINGTNGNDSLYGGPGNDTLYGFGGNDDLIGEGGNDTMIGGQGDDFYYVYDMGDTVIELPNEGIDTVHVDLPSYTLLPNFENLMISGEFGPANGTGNELDNIIWGNGSENTLEGMGGNDTFYGYGGADIMIGGEGNDYYYVNNVGDTVIEFADEGYDRVNSSVSYSLEENVEDLRLTGTSAINATGNDQNNVIYGNQNANTLDGRGGDDTFEGEGGDDTMIGGMGNDYYSVDSVGDTVIELADEGIDTVHSRLSSYTLGANVENLRLNGEPVGPSDGTGNQMDNRIIGNNRENILDGGAGNDTLYGGDGNDNLIGGTGNDALSGGEGDDTYIFNTGDGVDIIDDYQDIDQDHLSFGPGIAPSDITDFTKIDNDLIIKVGTNGDQLTLINWYTGDNGRLDVSFSDGTVWDADYIATLANEANTNPVITGTDGDDVLTGTANNDTLQGMAGNDTLSGGVGDDTYLFNSGDGVDTIMDSDGIDTIQFGEGITADSISLGLGSLLLRIGDQGDQIHIENFNPDDPIASSAIETFQFFDGTTLDISDLLQRGFDIQGSEGDDLLTGTSITDRITGEAGADTLVGGKGNDILTGGIGNDTYEFNLGDGVDIIEDVSSLTEGNLISFGADITAGDLTFGRDGDDLIIGVGSQGDALRLKDFDRFGNNGLLVADTLQFADGSQESLFHLTNTAPEVGVMPQNQAAVEDLEYSFTIPLNTFSDVDAGDSLTYTATLENGMGLPAWLVFDPATRTFGGTPADGDAGILDVVVVATDTAGATAVAGFALDVANYISGTATNNNILGTDLRDVIVGGTGNDTLNGGGGDDTFIVEGSDQGYDRITGGEGYDKILGGTGDDTIRLNNFRDDQTIEEIDGGDGINVIAGGPSNYDYLDFSATKLINIDRIDAGSHNDTVIGSDEADVIVGGTGNDTLNGGAGDDTFIVEGSDQGYDRITGGE